MAFLAPVVNRCFNKILIIGAADLKNVEMFLKLKCPVPSLIVTELRSFEVLKRDYGSEYVKRYKNLNELGVEMHFGINALNLHTKPFLHLLKNVGFVFWGCPYFGRDLDYDSMRGRILNNFFDSVGMACESVAQPMPKIGIALDCKSHDGEFNRCRRFDSHEHVNWRVECLVDLEGYYEHSVTDPVGKARMLLPSIYSSFVSMLMYEFNPLQEIQHGEALVIPVEVYKIPEFVDFKQKNLEFNLSVSWYPLSKIPVVKLSELFKNGNFIKDIKPYTINILSTSHGCFSLPTYRFPLSETQILREVGKVFDSPACAYIRVELKRSLLELTTGEKEVIIQGVYQVTKGGAIPFFLSYPKLQERIARTLNSIFLQKEEQAGIVSLRYNLDLLIKDLQEKPGNKLDLSNEGFCDETARDFAKKLQGIIIKKLYYIDLCNNNLTNIGFSAIMRVLSSFPDLRWIDFSQNELITSNKIIHEMEYLHHFVSIFTTSINPRFVYIKARKVKNFYYPIAPLIDVSDSTWAKFIFARYFTLVQKINGAYHPVTVNRHSMFSPLAGIRVAEVIPAVSELKSDSVIKLC
ncbi:MAG: hypothetical protein A2X78_04505 [Gammaproteobacteria bacterium GWE2_37_16]|nr:MAG: hypothetical protein A2X78_04505 [Gammaproteobacteria bacterium GWE2_37_16]